MGAETANTLVTIYRGTTSNQFGDLVDSNVPYITDLPATLIETGKSVQDPSTPTPRTIQRRSTERAGVGRRPNTDRVRTSSRGTSSSSSA